MSDSFDPMDCSPPAPLSMEFSRQEYWSVVPCPSPGDLPDPGIDLRSLTLQVGSLPSEPPGNSNLKIQDIKTGHLVIKTKVHMFKKRLRVMKNFLKTDLNEILR